MQKIIGRIDGKGKPGIDFFRHCGRLWFDKTAADGVISLFKRRRLAKGGNKPERIGMMRQGFLFPEFNVLRRIKGNDHAIRQLQPLILNNLLNDAAYATGIYPDRIVAGKAQLNGDICSVAYSGFRQRPEKQYPDLF